MMFGGRNLLFEGRGDNVLKHILNDLITTIQEARLSPQPFKRIYTFHEKTLLINSILSHSTYRFLRRSCFRHVSGTPVRTPLQVVIGSLPSLSEIQSDPHDSTEVFGYRADSYFQIYRNYLAPCYHRFHLHLELFQVVSAFRASSIVGLNCLRRLPVFLLGLLSSYSPTEHLNACCRLYYLLDLDRLMAEGWQLYSEHKTTYPLLLFGFFFLWLFPVILRSLRCLWSFL